jgi:hypothetical protein
MKPLTELITDTVGKGMCYHLLYSAYNAHVQNITYGHSLVDNMSVGMTGIFMTAVLGYQTVSRIIKDYRKK